MSDGPLPEFDLSKIHIEFAPLTFDGPDLRTNPHVGGRPGRIAWRRGLDVRAILRAKREKRRDEIGLGLTLRYFVPVGRRAIPAIGTSLTFDGPASERPRSRE